MMPEVNVAPRILLISQWPNVKNGEYELIEKIKQTGYKITVVDYLGFDVETGQCLNHGGISEDYDFAISFHYDTPKFINIRTYLWVANPLEFMHLRGDYRNVLFNHLRSYDDYLYNGSDVLKEHIKNVVGREWRDTGLEMFPACSRKEIRPPKLTGDIKKKNTANKIFYCGVNWERGIDRAGRAQGLLDILQEKQAADFYGPDKLEGISPWEGFSSYKCEIPFDGISMSATMKDYGAVLAVSSPAHMKSQTSSSRVFEGIAAGVPVISDENPHVRKLFGELVYYFKGDTEEEKATSILAALSHILDNPEEAQQRIIKAQELMATRFCFEASYGRIMSELKQGGEPLVTPTTSVAERIDIFLFHHDPDSTASGSSFEFHNSLHVLQSASYVAKTRGSNVRIITCTDNPIFDTQFNELHPNVEIVALKPEQLTNTSWHRLRLGEKVALLVEKANADLVSFFTQFDFPHIDYFSKSLTWFAEDKENRQSGLYLTGYFVDDLTKEAELGTAGIQRNN
ncbi:MAG: glycosyltransferase, partial [Burkholderiales bacterium]|nr:glycosyltransferase [Burkholderiales bacterium]